MIEDQIRAIVNDTLKNSEQKIEMLADEIDTLKEKIKTEETATDILRQELVNLCLKNDGDKFITKDELYYTLRVK